MPRSSRRGIVVLATGPLTSARLSESIRTLLGEGELYFYDSMAPIVTADSLDFAKIYRASRYGKGEGEDYLNCPLDRAQYEEFISDLLAGETVPIHDFEKGIYFEGCLPIEVMAERGAETLRHGPLKPMGLEDPRTGRRPHAVVQLRQDDLASEHYNLVGFQTKLRVGEQKRIFRKIPGLENANFVRFGMLHRNTYIHSPAHLDRFFRMQANSRVFFAGQITGVEGYLESAATGLYVGRTVAQLLEGADPVPAPFDTALGSLSRHCSQRPRTKTFEPMNVTFGMIEDSAQPEVRDRAQRRKIVVRPRARIDRALPRSSPAVRVPRPRSPDEDPRRGPRGRGVLRRRPDFLRLPGPTSPRPPVLSRSSCARLATSRRPATRAPATDTWTRSARIRRTLRVRAELADYLWGTGNPTEAEAQMDWLVARGHPRPGFLRYYGLRLFEAGNFVKASQVLESASREGSPDYDLLFCLGTARLEKGDFPGSEQSLRGAIRKSPGQAAAHHILGNLLKLTARPREAVVELRLAAAADESSADSWLDLAQALAANGERPEAEEACRRSIRLQPDRAAAHLTLGRILRARGESGGIRVGARREPVALRPRRGAGGEEPRLRRAHVPGLGAAPDEPSRRRARAVREHSGVFRVRLERARRSARAARTARGGDRRARTGEDAVSRRPLARLRARPAAGLGPAAAMKSFALFLGFLMGATISPSARSGPRAAPAPAAPCPVSFEDVAAPAGISFRHERGATGAHRLAETIGSGVAWLDFDNDGWLDLFVVQSGALPEGNAGRLFRNNGNGTFTDVTVKAGIGTKLYGMGAAAADYDNDGFVDLYVTGYGRNVLYHNNGNGTFTDVTDRAGARGSAWSTSAAWADFDGDGFLDLAVVRYVDTTPEPTFFCGDRSVNRRDYCDPELYPPAPMLLLHNNGDGTFRDISESSGVAAIRERVSASLLPISTVTAGRTSTSRTTRRSTSCSTISDRTGSRTLPSRRARG